MVPKIIIFVIFAWAIVLTCGEGISEGGPPEPLTPDSSSTSSTTSTTPASTTTVTTKATTTTASTTTTRPTTITTEPPTTPTTTIDPHPHPTTPTTHSPTSPSTTPKPTPKPPQKPDVGKWNVTQNNITCILVDMAIQLNISHTAGNKTEYKLVNVPKDAVANGTCGNMSQIIDLVWEENNKTFGDLILEFTKNDSTKHFMISTINVTIVPGDVFPDIKSNISLFANEDEFSTPVSKSYRCAKVQTFKLRTAVNGSNETVSEMLVSHVQLEAFHTKKDGNFGAAEDCEPSTSPDIVPIAVGCALVGLVAIVLIAYLVGRRRSQARGYLSM